MIITYLVLGVIGLILLRNGFKNKNKSDGDPTKW